MNIGFMYGVFTYPPRVGGSVHGYQLARGLTNRKHKLYTWYYGNEDYPFCEHFKGREILRFLRTVDVLYMRIEFPHLMEPFKLSRLLFHTPIPTAYEFNALPSEIPYYPSITLDPTKVAKRLRRLSGKRKAAIGVTEGIRRYLDKDLGFQRAYCIPNGSDPRLFYPREKDASRTRPLIVVWIGQTSISWHDMDTVIKSAAILHESKASVLFRIYGEARYLPDRLPPNLEIRDLTSYDGLGTEIGDADVGLHIVKSKDDVGRLEFSPLKIFDYMACGLAIVTQADGQRGRVIRDRNSGLITSGSPEDLASKIQILENDRELCRRLGANGRRAVEEYYNWDRVAEETERVLLDLVDSA
jgi:glycosyltransferase involved in cell wall biosynthesis